MLRNVKRPQYFKSFLLGMSAIVLPLFPSQHMIQKVIPDTLSDGEKVKSDYVKSVEGIKKEVAKFEYRR